MNVSYLVHVYIHMAGRCEEPRDWRQATTQRTARAQAGDGAHTHKGGGGQAGRVRGLHREQRKVSKTDGQTYNKSSYRVSNKVARYISTQYITPHTTWLD